MCTASPSAPRGVDRINAAGGSSVPPVGGANETCRAANSASQINIDTASWFGRALHGVLATGRGFDFRPPGKIFMDEYAKFISSHDKLGSTGQIPI